MVGHKIGVTSLHLLRDPSQSHLVLEYFLLSLRRELRFVCLFVYFCIHSSDLGGMNVVRDGKVTWELVPSLKNKGGLGLPTALGMGFCQILAGAVMIKDRVTLQCGGPHCSPSSRNQVVALDSLGMHKLS